MPWRDRLKCRKKWTRMVWDMDGETFRTGATFSTNEDIS